MSSSRATSAAHLCARRGASTSRRPIAGVAGRWIEVSEEPASRRLFFFRLREGGVARADKVSAVPGLERMLLRWRLRAGPGTADILSALFLLGPVASLAGAIRKKSNVPPVYM